MQVKPTIPWFMAGARAALGPVIIVGERCKWSPITLACIVVAALLSDIFDGILARRWHCDTPAVRLFDSLADNAFYLGVGLAIATGMPAVWASCRWGVLAFVSIELLRLAIDCAKFRKPASYHSLLAKTWGLVLAIAVVQAFLTQRPSLWMTAACILGILSNLESLAMTLMLPTWRRDVLTLAAAWRLRTAASSGDAPTPAIPGRPRWSGLLPHIAPTTTAER